MAESLCKTGALCVSLVLGSEEVGSFLSSFQEFYYFAFFFIAVTFLLLRGRNMFVGGGYVVSVCFYLYCIPSAPTCIFVKCLPWRRCVSSMNSVGKHITIHALLAGCSRPSLLQLARY